MTEFANATEEEIRSVGRVLRVLSENEADYDHISTLVDAWERMIEEHGFAVWPDGTNPTEEDVALTLDLLEENDPTEEERERYRERVDGKRHPDRVYGYAREIVDTEARYVNGILPEPRTWTVRYRDGYPNGEILEEREYEHDDDIPTSPEIGGVQYESTRVSRGEEEVEVYVQEEP